MKKETEVRKAQVEIKNNIIVLSLNTDTVRFYDDNHQILKKFVIEDHNPYRKIDFKQKEIKSIRQRDCFVLSEMDKKLKKSLFGNTTNTSVHKDLEAYMYCLASTMTNTSKYNLAVAYVLELKSREASEDGHSVSLGGITHVDIYNKIGEIIQSFDFENLDVHNIALSDDGRYLALSEGRGISPDQEVPNFKYHFYDVATKEQLYYYNCHTKDCEGLRKRDLSRFRFQFQDKRESFHLNIIDLDDRIHYETEIYFDKTKTKKNQLFKDYYIISNIDTTIDNKRDTVKYNKLKIN